jgi:succinate-acetate transporter protein
MFLTLLITFFLLMLGYYQENVSLIRGGGGLGVAVSFVAVTLKAQVLTPEFSVP